MKPLNLNSIILAFIVLLTSCASSTLIQSNPPGAKVYVDGQLKGKTPYKITDTKISLEKTAIKLELDNYETLNTTITKSEEVNIGAVIGGFFFLVPFIWTLQYYDTHTYDLQPYEIKKETPSEAPNPNLTPTEPNKNSITLKAEKLRELKKIFDEGLITKEEYEKEKKKILDEK